MKKVGRVPGALGESVGRGWGRRERARGRRDGVVGRVWGVGLAARGAREIPRARGDLRVRGVASLGGRGNGGKNQMHPARGGGAARRTSPSRPRPRGRCRWPDVPPWRRTRRSRRRTCRPTRARATSRDSFRVLFQVGHALRGPIPLTGRRFRSRRPSRAATFARHGFRRATRPERGEDGFARRVVRRDARRRDGSARRRSRQGSLGTAGSPFWARRASNLQTKCSHATLRLPHTKIFPPNQDAVLRHWETLEQTNCDDTFQRIKDTRVWSVARTLPPGVSSTRVTSHHFASRGGGHARFP